ncbi:hypothetical protein [Streptomyces sp. NPDC048825]|uniref:hypothetical protein n=1 Tax=Streptomyces sp. NPDC048825 TaxID=3365592 RepID=UPI003723D0AD
MLTALRTFRDRLAKEKFAAGEAYETSGRVVDDGLGRAVKTDWLRRRSYEPVWRA